MTQSVNVLFVGESSAAYRNGGYFVYVLERTAGIRVSYSSPGFYASLGVFGRAVSFFHLFVKVAACDRLFVLPMCQIQPYVRLAVRLAGWLRKKVWVDAYISFYETQVCDRKNFLPDSEEARDLLVKERRLFERCERVIFLNRSESAYYSRVLDLQLRPEQIAYVPLVAPFRPQAALPRLGGGGTLTFAWWGRLGNPLHGLDRMLEAFAGLPHRSFRLVLAADGAPKDTDKLSAQLKNLGLAELVELRSDLTFNDGSLLDFLLRDADVALGVFGSTGKAKTVNVNKVIDALSLGMPCITLRSEALGAISDADDFLDLWDGRDTTDLSALIKAGIENHKIWRTKANMAPKAFLQYFSPVVFERALDTLMEGISRD